MRCVKPGAGQANLRGQSGGVYAQCGRSRASGAGWPGVTGFADVSRVESAVRYT